MKLGNILAGIGMIFCLVGFFSLPIYNLHELSYAGDPSYPKGGGWIRLAALGLFAKPGIFLMIIGGVFLLTSKFLPKKYWATSESLLARRTKKGRIKKKQKRT